jgi:hypothetical protein
MANIDFFTFININSNHFADFLRETGELTKSGKHNIHWKCVLSNGAEEIPKGFDCVSKQKRTSSNPSMRHAIAIHDAIQKATSDYIIISDVDIALTYKNWDDEIVRILDEGYSCFGTPNSTNENGEQDFPNVPFFTFKKEILQKVNLDFSPILDERNKITGVKAGKEKIMGRGIKNFVFLETGCQISQQFEKAGLKSKCLCMEPVGPLSQKIQLPRFNFKLRIKLAKIINKVRRFHHNYLFEFHHNNNIFLSHIGNGSGKTSDSIDVQMWKKKAKEYLKKYYP